MREQQLEQLIYDSSHEKEDDSEHRCDETWTTSGSGAQGVHVCMDVLNISEVRIITTCLCRLKFAQGFRDLFKSSKGPGIIRLEAVLRAHVRWGFAMVKMVLTRAVR